MSYFKQAPVIYHDSAIHDIDWICWVAGEEPVGVFAHGVAHHQGIAEQRDFDTIAIVLSFPSGVIGTIAVSRYSTYGYDQRAEVCSLIKLLIVFVHPAITVIVAGKTFTCMVIGQFAKA